jgi:hypothetical protein
VSPLVECRAAFVASPDSRNPSGHKGPHPARGRNGGRLAWRGSIGAPAAGLEPRGQVGSKGLIRSGK